MRINTNTMSEMKKMNGKKSMKTMKGMKWILVLLAVFLVAGVFVGATGAAAITLDPDGGNVSSTSITIEEGKTTYGDYNLPTPTRTGFTFDGTIP